MRLLFCAALIVLSAKPAFAYRPFDSTDAAVADRGAIEFECGPIGLLANAGTRSLIVPAAILNVGLANGWEAVAETKNFVRVGASQAQSSRLLDSAISVKKLLRAGSLQDHSGLSIAFEGSLLLPTGGDGSQAGVAMTSVVSRRFSNATIHLNGAAILETDGRWVPASGLILEGPGRWRIRPVGELTLDGWRDRTTSTLVGAIWEVGDHLALDAGWRMSRLGGSPVRELRAGFTWELATSRSTSAPPATDGPSQNRKQVV
jgi:hypothetical protein